LYVSSITPLKLTKLQLPPWNCTMLVNLLPPSNFSVSEHDVLQIPPWSFALMCKMPLKLENLYFCVMRTIACQNFIYLFVEFLIIYGYYLRRKTNTTKVKIIQMHWFLFSNIEQISVMIQAKQMRHGDVLLEVEDMFYVGIAITNGLWMSTN